MLSFKKILISSNCLGTVGKTKLSVVEGLGARRRGFQMTQTPQIKRKLAKALYDNYGRRANYSRHLDKLNRMPLLSRFVRENADVPSFATREEMWNFLADRSAAQIDYLEFGVHEGHSILHWAKRNATPESRFFGFDTFSGLPEDWSKAYPRGHFDTGGRLPQTSDARVQFVKGLFQDTLPVFLESFAPRGQLIVNNDSDLYSSTLYCLTNLDKILTPGTIVIFDEFGDVSHEFRALHDYVASYRREFKVLCSHDQFFTIAIEIV
jgi:O-methyltransferase